MNILTLINQAKKNDEVAEAMLLAMGNGLTSQQPLPDNTSAELGNLGVLMDSQCNGHLQNAANLLQQLGRVQSEALQQRMSPSVMGDGASHASQGVTIEGEAVHCPAGPD